MTKIEVNERIKLLRSEILKNEKDKKYSARQFAQLLGVSYGVINNIEYNRTETKDYIIKLICLTFNINEDWLRNGTEPIFKEEIKRIDALNLLSIEYGLTKEEINIIKNFINLKSETKQGIIQFIKNCIKDIN
ncbi:MAG: helix-turn-helix domain-containing protein [Eubacteriales bacterium]|nr:helix-turn-helix domain-containing protein [Eubacteriales bacterium]